MKITEEVKICIRNLFHYFNTERKYPDFTNLHKRTSAALGIPLASMYASLRREKPKQKKKSNHICYKKLDGFDRDVVRETMHQLNDKGKYFSLKMLVKILEEKGIIISQECLRLSLKKMGFRYYASHGKRFRTETTEIVAARHSYLRKIRQYREQGVEEVYQDETWVNSNHAKHGVWTENKKGETSQIIQDCSRCDRYIPSGKGTRLIVLDAGSSRRGFIPGVGLVFQSKTKSADYHDEMNGRTFLEWFQNVLVPGLGEHNCDIIMDNASYHNIRTERSWFPKASSTKVTIREWLAEKGIPFSNDELKPSGFTTLLDKNNRYFFIQIKAELLKKVSANKPLQEYQTDVLAAAHGHSVLRLPVRHCELNPIELIQAQEKGYVARNNPTFKMKDVKRLYLEGKQKITAEDWLKVCIHVIEKVENRFWAHDELVEDSVPPVVIPLNCESGSESECMEVASEGCESGSEMDGEEEGDVVCKICNGVDVPAACKSVNVDWVACDICEEWVHEFCAQRRKKTDFCCSSCLAILRQNSSAFS